MQQVEVFTLWELVDRLLTLQGGSLDDVWADSRNALFQQLERAANSGKLRVRHPETMLPEVFAEWAPPSNGELVCTIADVNAWLASEGVPYSVTPLPGSTAVHPQAVPVVAPPVVAGGKKWTPEKLAELKAYREANTMKATAEKFGIAEQRIRQLLPTAKPKTKPFAGLIHRI